MPDSREFDRYADRYVDLLIMANGFAGKGAEFFTWFKGRKLLQVADELGLGSWGKLPALPGREAGWRCSSTIPRIPSLVSPSGTVRLMKGSSL